MDELYTPMTDLICYLHEDPDKEFKASEKDKYMKGLYKRLNDAFGLDIPPLYQTNVGVINRELMVNGICKMLVNIDNPKSSLSFLPLDTSIKVQDRSDSKPDIRYRAKSRENISTLLDEYVKLFEDKTISLHPVYTRSFCFAFTDLYDWYYGPFYPHTFNEPYDVVIINKLMTVHGNNIPYYIWHDYDYITMVKKVSWGR